MKSLLQTALALLIVSMSVAAARSQTRLPTPLADQIRALASEKATRSPAERKISSRLLYADKLRRGVPIAAGIPHLRTGVEVAADGTTAVDVRAEDAAAVARQILDLSGHVVHASQRYGAVRARIPMHALRELAEIDEVLSIRPADHAITRKINTSEGDAAHAADLTREAFGVDGNRIRVGVLSDGVDSLASLQSSGDLPSTVTVLGGQEGFGTEGTAVMEIIHDLAPGADLLFATAVISQASFASNILALHEAGAEVIVDDIFYLAESVFQDDNVADAVNTVTAAGALYFSSAGNGGNLNNGTSGVWEGDFTFSGDTLNGDEVHAFAAGVSANEITAASPVGYTLHWSDPNGGSGNDYDLLLVGNAQIVAASTDVQDGNDDAFESIAPRPGDRGRKLMVVRSAGADRYIHLNANRGALAIATTGQTSGHSAALDAFSVAAVNAIGTSGPFDGSESVQPFSSDGPRRVFFEADGSEITPGNLLATGGELRDKPDLTGADCVSTATPGFSIFCGTSASAAHGAAIAALLLELSGSATPEQIRTALTSTALDIEAPGYDHNSGHGIVDALGAAQALPEPGGNLQLLSGLALLALLRRLGRGRLHRGPASDGSAVAPAALSAGAAPPASLPLGHGLDVDGSRPTCSAPGPTSLRCATSSVTRTSRSRASTSVPRPSAPRPSPHSRTCPGQLVGARRDHPTADTFECRSTVQPPRSRNRAQALSTIFRALEPRHPPRPPREP